MSVLFSFDTASFFATRLVADVKIGRSFICFLVILLHSHTIFLYLYRFYQLNKYYD